MPCYYFTKRLHNFSCEFCFILRNCFKHQSAQNSLQAYNFYIFSPKNKALGIQKYWKEKKKDMRDL